jgi:hypothetical protein
MEKTNVNTALAIVFIASAVMLIGGLAATTLTTTAMAAKPDFPWCAGNAFGSNPNGFGVCSFRSLESCEEDRERFGIKGHCHPMNPDALD